MGSYYIWTVGCQMNVADSERLGAHLERLGYQSAQAPEAADILVINSCVVRQHAEDRVANKLYNLRPLKKERPGAVVALMGCMVGPKSDELRRRFPHVDVFMRPQDYEPLLEVARERADLASCQDEGPVVPNLTGPTAFVPVIKGCNEFCTFCIVPYRRGRQVSRDPQEIITEVQTLAGHAIREVTLLGQTVDAYGLDLPGQPDLADLLTEINGIDGLSRIRFLTSHPRYMTQKLIRAIAGLEKVCEHINVPFQAGDDGILESMRRTYSSADYRRLIADIRCAMPEVGLDTDVIVGFPGETDEQFQRTLDLLEEVRFDVVHVAAYSVRPGTIAARSLTDDIPKDVKAARLRQIEQVQERVAAANNAPMLGRDVEVLAEKRDALGNWQGRTRTHKLVHFPAGVSDLLGELVTVRVKKTSAWSLQGELVAVG